MPRKPWIPHALASRVFHIDEARRNGLTKDHLDGPTWTRFGGGLYALSEIANDPLIRLAAARRRLPDMAVFSGHSAAWLHRLEDAARQPIEVTVPLDSPNRRLAGLSVCRAREVERAFVKGFPVTTRPRTVADLARRLNLVEAVVVIDTALHRRLVRLTQMRQWMARHNGYRGIATLRNAIELAEPRTESPMETRLRMLLVVAGLPPPQVQAPLGGDVFIARADLYYPRARLAIEYDGSSHRDSLAADDRRQNRLLEAGYRLLRFTARDVLDSPASVVGLVRRALEA